MWEAIPQMLSCFRSSDIDGNAFNIGKQGDEITILDLAYHCSLVAGLPSSVIQYNKYNKAQGMQRCQPDTTRVRDLLPDSFSISLQTGLQTCNEWIKHLIKIQ